MKTLVLGSSGQLAYHLMQYRGRFGLTDDSFWARTKLDWTSTEQPADLVQAFKPTHIINTTAYTNVDAAETDRDPARIVNTKGPELLAQAAQQVGALLVHISTDYVFGNSQPDIELSISSPKQPLNVYGETKLAGEQAIAQHTDNFKIIRTSWLFSEHGTNFVKTMLRLSTREQLRVVADQVGRPTYAGDLAAAVVACLSDTGSIAPGVYHLSGGRSVSWYEFAQEIFNTALRLQFIERAPELIAIPTSEYPTPAGRPLNSKLAHSEELPEGDWQRALPEVLKSLFS